MNQNANAGRREQCCNRYDSAGVGLSAHYSNYSYSLSKCSENEDGEFAEKAKRALENERSGGGREMKLANGQEEECRNGHARNCAEKITSGRNLNVSKRSEEASAAHRVPSGLLFFR